nr:hypothetical protein [Tanacetum cinerariifolium]
MTTLADKAILSGADNHPPMLEKENMVHSFGPTIEENGVTSPRKYNELTHAESKFVTDVKIVWDFHITNIDQHHAYLEQHELHANEVPLMHEHNSDPLALVATHQLTQLRSKCSVFKHGDDPIDAINCMMSFLTSVIISRYPTTNNQLKNLSNPRQQATINDGRVTLQPVQGRQISFASGTSRTYTPAASVSNSRKQRVVICYNCRGEGHISKQCTKPKRKRDDSWFKDKVLLVQAQANGQILYEEELAFLADLGIPESQATQTVITQNATYQADDMDAYEFDCDEFNTAKVALLANLFHYGSDALADVHNLDNVDNNMINHAIQVISSSEQSNVMNYSETKITTQSQEKDTVISKLKERIKSLSGNINTDKVKKDIEEIETINIKLDHRVSKLITENKHLKQTYKQLYDSIKSTRIRSNEQCDALTNQFHQKSVEISDLNVSLLEQDLVITSLKNDLRKLKGKALVDNVVTSHTIDPEMLKIDVEPLAPKLLNNRIVYSDYLRHTQEQAAILREVVEQGKSQNRLNNSLEHASKITTTTKVPSRNVVALETETPKLVVTLVYSRKPRKSKITDPVGKSMVIKYVSTNKKEPSKSWGSTVSNVPSSSLDECRLSKLFSGI